MVSKSEELAARDSTTTLSELLENHASIIGNIKSNLSSIIDPPGKTNLLQRLAEKMSREESDEAEPKSLSERLENAYFANNDDEMNFVDLFKKKITDVAYAPDNIEKLNDDHILMSVMLTASLAKIDGLVQEINESPDIDFIKTSLPRLEIFIEEFKYLCVKYQVPQLFKFGELLDTQLSQDYAQDQLAALQNKQLDTSRLEAQLATLFEMQTALEKELEQLEKWEEKIENQLETIEAELEETPGNIKLIKSREKHEQQLLVAEQNIDLIIDVMSNINNTRALISVDKISDQLSLDKATNLIQARMENMEEHATRLDFAFKSKPSKRIMKIAARPKTKSSFNTLGIKIRDIIKKAMNKLRKKGPAETISSGPNGNTQ